MHISPSHVLCDDRALCAFVGVKEILLICVLTDDIPQASLSEVVPLVRPVSRPYSCKLRSPLIRKFSGVATHSASKELPSGKTARPILRSACLQPRVSVTCLKRPHAPRHHQTQDQQWQCSRTPCHCEGQTKNSVRTVQLLPEPTLSKANRISHPAA